MIAASQPAQGEPAQLNAKISEVSSEPASSKAPTSHIVNPGDIMFGRDGKHLSTKVPEAEVSKLTLAEDVEEGTDVSEEEDVEVQPR
jgi:hypothetical protein